MVRLLSRAVFLLSFAARSSVPCHVCPPSMLVHCRVCRLCPLLSLAGPAAILTQRARRACHLPVHHWPLPPPCPRAVFALSTCSGCLALAHSLTLRTDGPVHWLAVNRRFQFSSELKRMRTVLHAGGRTLLAVKGAPNTICGMPAGVPPFYDERFKWYTRRGARVLALR